MEKAAKPAVEPEVPRKKRRRRPADPAKASKAKVGSKWASCDLAACCIIDLTAISNMAGCATSTAHKC